LKQNHKAILLRDGKMRVWIEVLTPLDGYHQEELEDKIKQLLKEYGVEAKIKSSTGNEMTVCKHLITFSEEDVWEYAKNECGCEWTETYHTERTIEIEKHGKAKP
jgi:hypothetical protein